MTQRPGVMLYFDIAPAIKRLSAEESGLLLRAILDYAEQGVAPDFESDMLGLVWDLLQPRLDRDAARYEEKALKARYSTYCREMKKRGLQPAEFEVWQEDPDNHPIPDDIGRYPSTNTTSSTYASSSTTAATTSTSTATSTMAAPKQHRSSTEATLSFDEPDFERQRRDALNKFRPFAR